jgi:hypothetical protein
MRPFDCRSLRIRRSIRSSLAASHQCSSVGRGLCQKHAMRAIKLREFGICFCEQLRVKVTSSRASQCEVCIYVEDMRLAGCGAHMAETHRSKVMILGSGPAGYTAAIYAARASSEADSRAGHSAGRSAHHHDRRRELSGLRRCDPGSLADGADAEAGRACRHQLFFDTIVTRSSSTRRPFVCLGDSGDRYEAESLIIATGATAKWLGLPSANRRFAAAACRPARPATASSSAARKWWWSAAATLRLRRRST